MLQRGMRQIAARVSSSPIRSDPVKSRVVVGGGVRCSSNDAGQPDFTRMPKALVPGQDALRNPRTNKVKLVYNIIIKDAWSDFSFVFK